MNKNLNLGMHCSISGGVHKAFDEVEALGVDAFQVFTKNQKQWRDPELKSEVVNAFMEKKTENKTNFTISHASYLLNLGSNDKVIWEKSVLSLQAEIERCQTLGIDYVVFHPGYAKGEAPADAISRIAKALKILIENNKGSEVGILLENTAGQGSSIGGDFQHHAIILQEVNSPKLGVCIDTCHAFAAGYDIRTKSSFEDVMAEFDAVVGIQHLKAWHLNDSKGALGSKLDRHENIGKGQLGLEPFRYIMQNFKHLPKVIETPKEDNMDAVNIEVLRGLV